jgi:ribosomal protein L37E
MSMTVDAPVSAGAENPGAENNCLRCGAWLETDQEWCLECGTARTVILRAPDWRIPAAIVGVVIALAVLGFLIALVNLSGNASQTATRTPARTTTRATAVTATTAPSQISSWPVGLPGWTVQIIAFTTQAAAEAKAKALLPTGIPIGIMNSSLHPSMPPGLWVVFSGRYPTEAAAAAEAVVLRAKGRHRAQARLVGVPGQ